MEISQNVASHILTVSLEDYFQGAAFRKILAPSHWSRFERRVQQNTDRTLQLLQKHGHRATFFVSAWLAEQVPNVVKNVVSEGHEVGSSGMTQRSFRQLSPGQLQTEVRESKALLEQLTGRRVRGFRVADHLLGVEHMWALRILAEEDYDFDSSLSPSLNRFKSEAFRYFPHTELFDGKLFYEFPLPALDWWGLQIPIAGGNYFRQIPETIMRRAISHWIEINGSPFTFYFRIWDLDPAQPEITGASRIAKLRHYRNAATIPLLLDRLLSSRRLVGISEHLQLPNEPVAAPLDLDRVSRLPGIIRVSNLEAKGGSVEEVTVVIPCYNESHSITYLANALQELRAATQDVYKFLFIFVDDGSQDDTWNGLQNVFGTDISTTLLRHSVNRGITAALLTGMHAARTEFVCSLDCDCTYDPLELANLIPLATTGVDCVTASPYHPDGKVLNVPTWRRFFSTGASKLYQVILGSRLHTFTSCFRVYRRSSILALAIKEPGFVGVAELIGKLHLQGGRIEEYPATLTIRMLGHSKMKLLRNTLRHLRLMVTVAIARLNHTEKPRKRDDLLVAPTTQRKGLTWLIRPK